MLHGREREKGDNFIRENFINLRPLAVIAIALATGAAFCYAFLFHGVSLWFSLLSLLPCAACVLFTRKKLRAVVCFFLFLAFLGVGMGGFACRIENYRSQTLSSGEYVLAGEIKGFTVEKTYADFLLEKVTADGKELDGNVTVRLYAVGVQAKEGTLVRFNAAVERAGDAYRYNVFRADMVLENIKYTAVAREIPVVTGEAANPFAVVRERVKEVLYDALPEEEAALAYALTTGNTDGIETGLLSSVRYGGVAHLFAVSGLHIGVVFAALAFVCKKCRAPKMVCTVLPLIAAFLFAGMCGFSPSSLRAFFICCAVATASLIGVRADSTESACFACGIILLLQPVYLFSVGFQLSAAAYLAVAVLSPALYRLFLPLCTRFPVLKKPARTLAVMLSVQLSLFPITLNAFGYASAAGFFLNPLLLPLFSLFFPVLLFGTFLACLFPVAAGVLLFLPGTVLSAFAVFFYTLDFSAWLIRGFSLGTVALFAFYALLFIVSGKTNVKGKRTPLVCFLISAVVFSAFAGTFVRAEECRIVQNCYYNDFCCALVRTEKADILLVNGKINLSRVQPFLTRQGAKLDAVVIAAEDTAACANSLLSVDCKELYVRRGQADGVSFRTRKVTESDAFSLGGVNFTFKGEGVLLLEYDGVTGVFNGTGYDADFSLFSAEERDGLIFRIDRGILYRE